MRAQLPQEKSEDARSVDCRFRAAWFTTGTMYAQQRKRIANTRDPERRMLRSRVSAQPHTSADGQTTPAVQPQLRTTKCRWIRFEGIYCTPRVDEHAEPPSVSTPACGQGVDGHDCELAGPPQLDREMLADTHSDKGHKRRVDPRCLKVQSPTWCRAVEGLSVLYVMKRIGSVRRKVPVPVPMTIMIAGEARSQSQWLTLVSCGHNDRPRHERKLIRCPVQTDLIFQKWTEALPRVVFPPSTSSPLASAPTRLRPTHSRTVHAWPLLSSARAPKPPSPRRHP